MKMCAIRRLSSANLCDRGGVTRRGLPKAPGRSSGSEAEPCTPPTWIGNSAGFRTSRESKRTNTRSSQVPSRHRRNACPLFTPTTPPYCAADPDTAWRPPAALKLVRSGLGTTIRLRVSDRPSRRCQGMPSAQLRAGGPSVEWRPDRRHSSRGNAQGNDRPFLWCGSAVGQIAPLTRMGYRLPALQAPCERSRSRRESAALALRSHANLCGSSSSWLWRSLVTAMPAAKFESATLDSGLHQIDEPDLTRCLRRSAEPRAAHLSGVGNRNGPRQMDTPSARRCLAAFGASVAC
jgi:hypothetical protein